MFFTVTMPDSVLNPITSRTIPMAIRARIVTTLIKANQNSNSPKFFTVSRLSANKMSRQMTAGIHWGIWNQYWTYTPTAITSAIAVMIQQNQ
ncbi:hypothetical protein D1872_278450 [compost metagenome]